MLGNLESQRLAIVAQIAKAQTYFDAGQIQTAEHALPWPRNHPEIALQFPELWSDWRKMHRQIQKGLAEIFLQKNIPLEFQSLDASVYPCPESLATALAFEPTLYDDTGRFIPGAKNGLLLHGQTGAGKTRAAFAVLSARLRSEYPDRQFRYVSAPVLKRQLADAARGGRSHVILEDLLGDTDATLFIDDLSQARFTPAFAENLFELVDRIHREHVDVIVTVQTNGADLVRKWCADDRDLLDTAQAIARRLREYCLAVRFTLPKAKPANPTL
jgi:DNA replication protein DnaC